MRGEQVIVIPYPPSVNRYWKKWNNRIVLSPQGRKYKERVKQLVQAAPTDGDVCLVIRVYRPQRRGDLDNTLKAILDSLSGLLYHDDKQVIEIIAQRFDDKKNPRVEVEYAIYRP